MIGNFCKGFIFTFFASQEPFTKLKLRKFCHPCAKQTNQVSISGLLGSIYLAANKSVSASMPLTAIAKAIQEIEVLRKHRRTNQTWCKAESGSNRYYKCPGYEGTFLATLEKRA